MTEIVFGILIMLAFWLFLYLPVMGFAYLFWENLELGFYTCSLSYAL